VALWLTHCATSRMVPASIPGHWRFFPGHQAVSCALRSTQPLKMSTRIFLVRKGDGLTTLRHCATSRRVPESIPGHWGFFLVHHTVPCVLGSNQPLKMINRIFLVRKGDDLTTFLCVVSRNSTALTYQNIKGH
jgi:hypothetical protein